MKIETREAAEQRLSAEVEELMLRRDCAMAVLRTFRDEVRCFGCQMPATHAVHVRSRVIHHDSPVSFQFNETTISACAHHAQLLTASLAANKDILRDAY